MEHENQEEVFGKWEVKITLGKTTEEKGGEVPVTREIVNFDIYLGKYQYNSGNSFIDGIKKIKDFIAIIKDFFDRSVKN